MIHSSSVSVEGLDAGTDKRSGELFSYVDLEQRVRADQPLQAIRTVVSEVLDALSGEFAALYSGMGRPSIAPEMQVRAMLLLGQAVCSSWHESRRYFRRLYHVV